MRESLRETCGASRAGADRRAFRLPGTPVQYPPDRVMQVEHVRLDLHVVPEKGSLEGRATLTVSPIGRALKRFGLDLCELTVDRVTVAGKPATFHHEGGRLEITPKVALALGRTAEVVVEYHGFPRTGLNFVGPDADHPRRPFQAWSQGQDEYARYWFPTHDYPNMKSSSEMVVTAPSRYATISNGALLSVKTSGKERVWHWKSAVPHVSYLVSLVVGEFDHWTEDCDGVPLDYHVPPGQEKDARRVFANTAEMVRLFADYTGQPYPYEKYAQVVVKEFTWGGMENTSATTLVDYVVPDARSMDDYGVYTAERLISHELAHQWFGDYLTCREWAHAWLNEGFASYFETLWFEHHLGHDEAQQARIEDAEEYLEEDAEYRRPIVCRTYVEPHVLFDRHLYEKGAMVLWMLRNVVGDGLFTESIREYVRRHRENLVVTEDLQRAFEDVSGQALGWFFDEWVYGGGHPQFEVRYEWDDDARVARLGVKQTQKVDDVTHVFRMPLEVTFGQPGGRPPVVRALEVGRRGESDEGFSFALDHRPTFVRFDRENRVLKTLRFERPDELLIVQLAEDEVTGRIEAANALGERGTVAATGALVTALRKDAFWGVRAAAARALGRGRTQAGRDALVAALAGAGKDPHARVRASAAAALGDFRSDPVAAKALTRAIAERSYRVAGAAANALGRTRVDGAATALRRAIDVPSHRDLIRQGALSGMEALHDTDLIPEVLRVSRPGPWSRLRQFALNRAAAMAMDLTPEQRRPVKEVAEQALFDPLMFVRLGGIQALRRLGSPSAIPAIDALAERDAEGAVRQACREAVEGLRHGRDQEEALRTIRDEVAALRTTAADLRDRVAKVEDQGETASKKTKERKNAKSSRGSR